MFTQKIISITEAFISILLLAYILVFVILTIHWPLVGDAPLIHYVVFLIHRGFQPYRQIVDPNLPGTYAIEAIVMKIFGAGALAWRIYDFSLLLLIGLSMAIFCGRKHRFAPIFASITFSLLHARDGLIQLGQRDLSVTALVFIGCASAMFAFYSNGWRSSSALFVMGLSLGFAATIKPVAILLLPIWLLIYILQMRANGKPWSSAVLLIPVGALPPLICMVAVLIYWKATLPFLNIMFKLVPLHASAFRLSFVTLIGGSISSVLLGVFLLVIPLAIHLKIWSTMRGQLLLSGFACGLIFFYVQGRGYPYHRYPSEAFLLLLAGLCFSEGIRKKSRLIC